MNLYQKKKNVPEEIKQKLSLKQKVLTLTWLAIQNPPSYKEIQNLLSLKEK